MFVSPTIRKNKIRTARTMRPAARRALPFSIYFQIVRTGTRKGGYLVAPPRHTARPQSHRDNSTGIGCLRSCTIARRTDDKDGDGRDHKGCAEKEVKLRWQPAAIKQRAARERREYCSKAADADRPPHAGGSYCSRVERWPDGLPARHRRVRDDAEQ